MTELSGELRDFGDIAFEAKLEQVVDTFIPEVTRLRSLVDAPEIEVALASLPVYRTYVIPDRDIDDADLSIITHLPEPIRSVFTHDSETTKEFIIRFQQTTAAVMAKGEEDTALYRYVRLLALNEVGGDPRRFGLSVQEFHDANSDRSRRYPQTIVCSQTHDTKRSGDVRARLVALSHRVDDWVTFVGRWHELSSKWRVGDAPDWTEELFIYQTLIGGWPIGMDRLGPYLLKALREAKRNTNWIEPDETWEGRVIEFCTRLCNDREFLDAFVPFADQIGLQGERIALAQLVLRLSSPGVPDIYQGDESWNLSFVDPDNRRPINWENAKKTLADLLSVSPQVQRTDAKLFVTKTMLELRHRHDEEFRGPYQPLPADTTTCAYRRGADVVVAVALRDQPISFELPYGTWSNVLGPIKNCYSPTPVAVFERASD
jgi:(1->4)-alpha-D-glucan 1-alpha-D-glucosylmutase